MWMATFTEEKTTRNATCAVVRMAISTKKPTTATRCGWPDAVVRTVIFNVKKAFSDICAVVRMPRALARVVPLCFSSVKTKLPPESGKKKGRYGSGPTPPGTNLLEHKKLTQLTQVPAVYRSRPVRSEQNRTRQDTTGHDKTILVKTGKLFFDSFLIHKFCSVHLIQNCMKILWKKSKKLESSSRYLKT